MGFNIFNLSPSPILLPISRIATVPSRAHQAGIAKSLKKHEMRDNCFKTGRVLAAI